MRLKNNFSIVVWLLFTSTLVVAQNWNWETSFGSTGVETIPALDINSDGSIIIAGSFNNSIIFENTTLTAIQGSDVFLSKLNQDGEVLWAIGGGSNNSDFSIDVKTDTEGNIFWLGQYWVQGFFENDTIQAGTNSKAYFLTKYGSNGALVWAKSINGSGAKVASSLAINSTNDVFVTGYFKDSLTVDDFSFYSPDVEQGFVLGISNDGTPLFGTSFGDNGTIRPQQIAITSDDQLVISGDLTGTVTFADDVLTSVNTDFDIFIASLDEDGEVNWGRIGTGVFDNLVETMEIDQNSDIYISGYFQGVLEIDGQSILTPGFSENLYLLKINTDGDLIWARGLNDQEFNDPSFGFDIAVKDDLVLMTGQYSGELIIDNLSLSEVDPFKGFIASFDGSTGLVKKLSQIGGSAQTSGSQITVDSEGQIYLAGTFTDNITLGNTLQSTGGSDIYIAQSSPSFTSIFERQPSFKSISIFPNPVRQSLFLDTPESSFTICIFNLTGQIIQTIKNEQAIDVSFLLPGMYFLNYTSTSRTESIPFVKS